MKCARAFENACARILCCITLLFKYEFAFQSASTNHGVECGGVPYAAREILSLNPAPTARVISLEMTVP